MLFSAGTGITPNYQIIKKVYKQNKELHERLLSDDISIKDFNNKVVKINHFYSNKTTDDILLQNELKEFETAEIKTIHFITREETNLHYKGRINQNTVKK